MLAAAFPCRDLGLTELLVTSDVDNIEAAGDRGQRWCSPSVDTVARYRIVI